MGSWVLFWGSEAELVFSALCVLGCHLLRAGRLFSFAMIVHILLEAHSWKMTFDLDSAR